MKKIVAAILITITLTQIGCGSIPVKQVSSIDQIQFKENHHYQIKLKTNESTQQIAGNNIHQTKDRLVIKNNNEEFPFSDIESITMKNDRRSGSYAGLGALIGVGASLAMWGFAIEENATAGDTSNDPVGPGILYLFAVITSGFSAGAGALIGLAFPKREKIKIVPMVSQSKTQGNTTGGMLQVNF